MEWLDILQRIEAGEEQNTEFKRGVGDLSAIGKAMCAFANGDGGLIVLGVNDSGTIAGVNEDPDAFQEQLTNFLHTGCSKPVTGVCGFQTTPSGCVHWVHVHRQQRGYDPFSHNGRFWIRRGRASGCADAVRTAGVAEYIRAGFHRETGCPDGDGPGP